MSWHRLSTIATAESAHAIAEALESHGARAVSLLDAADQPLYEPAPGATPIWANTRVEGLFEASVDWEAVASQVAASLGLAGATWRCEPLDDQVWERVWMERFKPMRFGRDLWIYPSTHPVPDSLTAVVRLDPGLAFGTGTHATTALCLEALDAMPPTAQRVIDYGCGSGVLAIAALVLGAQAAWCHDIDPQALLASEENARRNNVATRLTTVTSPRDLGDVGAELILANILSAPLRELAPTFASLLAPGGRLVLSGILAPQCEVLMGHYAPWFAQVRLRTQEEWACIEAVRLP